ncbi:hypothetical protein BpHYR1_042919 [Brachionus plicatilis]|uniref:Uncharacterized protein n=1 Tax=Brachionus plicatilis TaxID=10195 RepID=A0A3M7QDL0_BRAPC|nr:hypothetical protein BpHYR1_042919 [Brachionus plicatilis]
MDENVCQQAVILKELIFESKKNNFPMQESNPSAKIDSSERIFTVRRSSEINSDDIAIDAQKCTLNVPIIKTRGCDEDITVYLLGSLCSCMHSSESVDDVHVERKRDRAYTRSLHTDMCSS